MDFVCVCVQLPVGSTTTGQRRFGLGLGSTWSFLVVLSSFTVAESLTPSVVVTHIYASEVFTAGLEPPPASRSAGCRVQRHLPEPRNVALSS